MEAQMEVANNNTSIAAVAPSIGRDVEATDILIPHIHLAQPTSTKLGEAPQGSFVRSTDHSVIGETLDIIPMSMYKNWVCFDVSGGKPQYKCTVPVTVENSRLPWNYEEDGVAMRRDMTMNFYCLLPADIAQEAKSLESDDPDPDDALLPVVVSFSRTSSKVGKEIATYFTKIEKFRERSPKASLYPSIFTLESVLNTTDQGKWYTWAIKGKTKSTTEQRESCAGWHKTILTSNAVSVHNVEEEELPVAHRNVSATENLDDIPF